MKHVLMYCTNISPTYSIFTIQNMLEINARRNAVRKVQLSETYSLQEAQLSPRDRAMRRVN